MIAPRTVSAFLLIAAGALNASRAFAAQEIAFHRRLVTPCGETTLAGYAPKLTVKAPVLLLLAEEDPRAFRDAVSAPSGCQWPVSTILRRGYAAMALDCSRLTGGFVQARTAAVRAAMDAIAGMPALDAARVAVIGQKRLGEAAVLAAAADPRVTFAFANNPERARAQKGTSRTGAVWETETGFDFSPYAARCVLGFEMCAERKEMFSASPAFFTRQGGTQLTGYDWVRYMDFLDSRSWRVDLAAVTCPRTFRVMVWNVEGQSAGEKELDALARVMRDSRADVVLVVENYGVLPKLARRCGEFRHMKTFSLSLGILSRWPIISCAAPYLAEWNYLDASGPYNFALAELDVDGQRVRCCPIWLNCDPFEGAVPLGGTSEDIVEWEKQKLPFSARRIDEINAVLSSIRRELSETDETALVIGGDFNVHSHLDWTEATKDFHGHGGHVVRWPVSAAMEEAGFRDTFRAVNPDPVSSYGSTWRNPKKAERREVRIDFIYSKGPLLKPVASEAFHSSRHRPFTWRGRAYKTFPSDHGFVLTTFSLLHPQMKGP